jgi:hypothetical protein
VTELIPLLRDLCFRKNKFPGVPEGFARSFISVHAEDWRIAQDHWERIVERVLDTDAVAPEADGEEAVRQAVAAAAELLARLAEGGRCPACPRLSVVVAAVGVQ